jgi:hypothetical protein
LPASARRCSGAKGVTQPLEADAVTAVTIHAHDVEAAGPVAVSRIARKERPGAANQFALFSLIHGMAGIDEPVAASTANFYERETVTVAHDEVEFAPPGPKIACDRSQAAGQQVAESELFSAGA